MERRIERLDEPWEDGDVLRYVLTARDMGIEEAREYLEAPRQPFMRSALLKENVSFFDKPCPEEAKLVESEEPWEDGDVLQYLIKEKGETLPSLSERFGEPTWKLFHVLRGTGVPDAEPKATADSGQGVAVAD
jgi:hypothetical protein